LAIHRLCRLLIVAIFVVPQNQLTMKKAEYTFTSDIFQLVKLVQDIDSQKRIIFAILKQKFDKEKVNLTPEEQKIVDLALKTKPKPKKTTRFEKPTIQEIHEYCMERRNGIDATKFYNHYESKGWKIGKTPMVNWKAAIHTWELDAPKDNRNNVALINWDGLAREYEKIFNLPEKSVDISSPVKREFEMRLNEGYTKRNILNAMNNCKNNQWHMDNKYQMCTVSFFSMKKTLDQYGNQLVRPLNTISNVVTVD